MVRTNDVQEQLARIADWPELGRRAHYRAAELARLCGVTRRSLERYFQARFRHAPQDSLDELRQRDLESWLRSERPLKEIAYLTGYKQPSHMTRQFKERHGLCPSEWRVQVAPVLSTDDQTQCVLQITCAGLEPV